jgi:hypothetical protein
VQQPAQTVLRFASLSHQHLAVIDQQLQIARRIVLHGRWQLGMRQRRTRDRESVDAVGLAAGSPSVSQLLQWSTTYWSACAMPGTRATAKPRVTSSARYFIEAGITI